MFMMLRLLLQFLRRMHQAVRQLPERYQTVVILRFVSGLSAEQIAHQMGMRPGAVRVLAAPADKEAEALRITADCTERMEHAIRQPPSEWVWMHQRWKTKPPEFK